MVVEEQRPQVRLLDLSREERMGVYWGCYWRAVLFVVLQIAVMAPVYALLTFLASRWFEDSRHDTQVFAGVVTVGELCSVVLGFCFVALFVRTIVNVRLGSLRFVLVREPVLGVKERGPAVAEGTPQP